jgi:hypothetical protein
MADYKYSTPKKLMEAICDAIRRKNGANDIIPHQDIPEQIDAILDATSLIDGSITSYSNHNITTMRAYTFAWCSNLESVDIPNVEIIPTSAFFGCGKLKEFYSPNATEIGNGAFNMSGGAKGIEKINCPKVTKVGDNCCQYVSSLVEVNLPELVTVGLAAFRNARVPKFVFPKLNSAVNNSFSRNTALRIFDVGYCSLGSEALLGCSSLDTIIFRSTTKMSALQNVANINNTPIASGTGYIYVPSSLVDTYKTATNWSVYANQIRAIEDWENRIDITTQPVDITAAVDEQITFDIVADGMGLEYQWEMSSDGGNTWSESTTNSGKTASYVVNVKQNYDGYKVRCKITNHEGYSIYSDVGTLTVTE